MFARVAFGVACLVVRANGQCPEGGHAAHDRCWYLSEAGQTCKATCAAKGLSYSFFVADAENPIVPKLLGRSPATKQFSWARTECYVPQGDRFHTAKSTPDSNTGDRGDPGDWSVDVCRLACSCSGGAEAAAAASAAAKAAAELASKPYPACVSPNTVLRHAGAHAIFVDLSAYGSMGCWQNDCKNTDKFNADNQGICARVCAAVDECTHWAFGEQEGSMKCFFRKSDAGREAAEGWTAAPKSCAPPAISDVTIAMQTGKVLQVCDAGKSDACPDISRAVATWRFAIKHLKKATNGKVDAGTMQYVDQIAADTEAFSSQMSEENFPTIVGNNRQVFNVLAGWMNAQPQTPFDANDQSLPNTLMGKLCGPNSCYERL
eukprot:TRINITY_DN31371_c0_g1_i1.p1 TRINITY_DN31371_c0_g1~~TRINITY_DN31371_c0_g1_i1.p1  ORF type:complete len:399 (-),score=79.18 TRINITY_DN31371_c0_g1_i1:196-1323(-)